MTANRYLGLIDEKGRASEDATTGALACLLNDYDEIREWFLDFLFAGHIPPLVAACKKSLLIKTQYKFLGHNKDVQQSLARIDLALISPSMDWMIGVEFKVRDNEKPGALEKYRISMNHNFKGLNYLFEIVQRREHPISKKIAEVLLWNDLEYSAKAWLPELRSSDAKNNFQEYLDFLWRSQTVLPEGKSLIKTPAGLPDAPPAEVCLDFWKNFSKKLPSNLAHDVASDKKVPPQLRIGRVEWERKFGKWFQRIYLNLRINPTNGRQYIYGSIIFYNKNFENFFPLKTACNIFPEWAAISASNGLVIWRGPKTGWDGAKRVQLHPPWQIDCKPKYFYAEEDLFRAAMNFSSDSEMKMDAMNRLYHLIEIVDSFPAH